MLCFSTKHLIAFVQSRFYSYSDFFLSLKGLESLFSFSACFLVVKEQKIIKLSLFGVPTGIRTPVPTVKGSCPRPLDDEDNL